MASKRRAKRQRHRTRRTSSPALPPGQAGPRRILQILGPGLVTGASDDDPSGIATYAAAGAAFGYATLWTALFTFPLMAAVQYICAKVAMVYGCGLAGVIKGHYRRLLYPVVIALLIANTINAAIAEGVNLSRRGLN